MQLHVYPFGPVGANMYVLSFGKEALVIDPCVPYSDTDISDLDVKAIFCTHAHFDHINEADSWKSKFSCPIYISSKDKALISSPETNFASDFGLTISVSSEMLYFPGNTFTEKDFGITEGEFELKIIPTPGHTSGSVCFLFHFPEEGDIMFTGDMLFQGSIGRTDLGGSEKDMYASIELLKTLPDSIVCFPGHGPKTKLGLEKALNPYFR